VSRAIVVHGEAGAGKTWLVRRACDDLGDDAPVWWGACVHFGEATVPFAPERGPQSRATGVPEELDRFTDTMRRQLFQ
jgi:hypothetical protein